MPAQELFSFSLRSDQFVDAIAVQPRASSSDASPLLAVAFSALESNEWGGGVAILDGVSGERLRGVHVATGVSSLAWTGDDNDVLAFGCDNGDVTLVRLSKIDDVEGGYVLVPVVASSSEATLVGHDDVTTGVAASALEKNVIASCSWDLNVKLWDITAMDKTLATLDGHSDLIWDIVSSGSEAHLWATASQDCTVQLWDDRLVTQSSTSTLSTQSFAALAVDWHPTETHLLAVGLENGSVLTFDTRATQSPLNILALHEGGIHSVKFSPFESDVLAVGSDDATVSVISEISSPAPQVQTLVAGSSPAHSDYVRAVEWYASSAASSKRGVLATGSWDHTVRTWDAASV